MNEILLKLADNVQPKDILYFLIFTLQFCVVVFLLYALRGAHLSFNSINNSLIKEIHENGNQLTQLTAVINFLALNKGIEENSEDAE